MAKRDRSALSILQAAKKVGAPSVTFKDGTVVNLASGESTGVSGNNAPTNGGAVSEWDGAKPM